MLPIPVFIGFDKVETVAFHVLAHSIYRHASVPVSITPVSLSSLKDVYYRERDQKQSNDFSFSRFLVPWMCGYKGHAIFMDCDMLCRGDVAELWEQKPTMEAVAVVKHDYTPRDATKYLGNVQHKYPKKNWSSVMVFNNQHFHTRDLTPPRVNTAPGLELHQFLWSKECGGPAETSVKALPAKWNHLVGEYQHDPEAKLVHFTVGGPYFTEYQDCDYADEWVNEYRMMKHCEQLPVPMTRASSK